jgi:non-ribosomal peptide synthetase component E (peptide arylation enzyme)
MTEPRLINVAKEFTPTPGGRYRREGEWSGEEFREDVLEKALAGGAVVVVDLDDVDGFTTSFLDEVFGELVRKNGLDIMDRVVVRADRRPSRAKKVAELVTRAAREKGWIK